MPETMDEILSEVSRLLAERAGMAPESFVASGIMHAVRNRLSVSGAASPQDYLQRLNVDPAEFQELLEDLVVPETWFFRDALAFRCLTQRLAVLRSANSGVVRILSVGCSTGEEVYSLAMAAREAGFPPGQFLVFGTDVSRRSLDLAQKGTFLSRSFREGDAMTAAIYQRWGEQNGKSWQVRDSLLAGVEFHHGNLAQADFLDGVPPFQVIFCRNVFIYFHAEARRKAVGNLRRLLAPDGVLWTAPAEARIFSNAGFFSLGSECPFGFRRGDESTDASGTAPAAWLRAKPQPFPGDAASLWPVPMRRAPPVAAPFSPGPTDADASIRPANGCATQTELDGQAILNTAKQAADDGRLEEADALCRQVLSRDPTSAAAHYLCGVVQQAQGALGEAQRSLEKALYLDPKHYEALLHMMLLAEQRGDQRAAANYRRRALQVASREAR